MNPQIPHGDPLDPAWEPPDSEDQFRDLREGDTFRFRHHPDDGPYVKISAREYLSLAVRRVGSRSAPVAKVVDVPALEHLARIATRSGISPVIDALAAAALEREIERDDLPICRRCGRPVVAPGKAGVHTVCPCPTAPAIDVDAIADELAADLLTCGLAGPSGTRGDRLAIMLEGRELAGWSREALTARLRIGLRKAAAGAPVLEAIQDQEAIERLALALRATSQWFTAAASAPQILWKLAEFLDNPEYARTAIKAGAGRPRS